MREPRPGTRVQPSESCILSCRQYLEEASLTLTIQYRRLLGLPTDPPLFLISLKIILMQQLSSFVINHWELFLALAVILGMIVGEPLLRSAQGYLGVGPTEATGLINHQDAVVLDVREENEFKEGHVLHAVHIPAGRLGERIKELEKYRNRPIIAVCRSGSRSGRVCSLLRKQGFATVYNLEGGLLAWQNASLPLTQKR
ncbi:phage shock protein E [Gammaproteobacteria bacterium]